MANSYVQYVGDGSSTTYSVPFPYLAKSHVQVRVNTVLKVEGVDYTWTTPSSILLATAPTNGYIVDIRRSSSPTERLVDFQDGSTLTQDILDLDSNQLFYLSQEAKESADLSLHKDTDGQWDAEGRRLKNVGTPVAPTDALTKATVDAIYPSVNSVATNLDKVTIVANDLVSDLVYESDLGSITNTITTLPTGVSRTKIVADNIDDIITVADNIAQVQTAYTNAVSAEGSAVAAANSAANALASSSAASVSAYNAGVSASSSAASSSQSGIYATNSAGSANSSAASATLANDWATKTSAPVAGGEYSAKYHAQAASNSATVASTNASAAQGYASSASSSAASAAGSAAGASASATSSASSAASASSSATSAAASAASAASAVDTAINALLDGAPASLNTLKELADAINDDANFAATVSTALGNRLRVDTNAQGLTTTQKDNAKTNLGLATVATSGAYSDLSGKPTYATVATTGAYSDLSGLPTYATVATTGSYTDLTNKPTLGSLAAKSLVTSSDLASSLDLGSI